MTALLGDCLFGVGGLLGDCGHTLVSVRVCGFPETYSLVQDVIQY